MSRISSVVGVMVSAILMSEAAYAALPDSGGSLLDWSGGYIGAFVAHSWAHVDYYEPDWPGYEAEPNMHGLSGGILLGYNHQVNSAVFGVEGDWGLGDLSEGPDQSAINKYSAFDINWNGHLRARIGVVAHSALFYVAGGIALAKVTVDDTDPNWGKDDSTHIGWTVGAGVEHAITRNLLMRIEYLYDDYGSRNYTITGYYPYKANVDLTTHTLRACVAYHF